MKIISIIFVIFLSVFAQAGENLTWLETDQVAKLGVEKIWFTGDLNKAVFLRSERPAQFARVKESLAKKQTQLDDKMSHLNDTLYFYNMSETEIQTWADENLKTPTSSVWIKLLIPKAHAESSDCAFNRPTTNIETKQGQSFFQKFKNVVNGNFIKKIVGCSTQDPAIDENKNQSLSIENFSQSLKNHWEQLKEIIAELPNMPIPEDVKEQLICDGISVGVFAVQGAALSFTGVGAMAAVPRLFMAFKRLMNSAKYLAKNIKKSSAKTKVVAGSTLASRTENVYATQKKFISNMQMAQQQIIDKGGRLAASGKGNRNYEELYDWAEAEVNVQKDLLKTLNTLEKMKNRSGVTQQISIQAERTAAEKRIQTLSKAFKF